MLIRSRRVVLKPLLVRVSSNRLISIHAASLVLEIYRIDTSWEMAMLYA